MNNKMRSDYNEKLVAVLGVIAEQALELDHLRPRVKDLEHACQELRRQVSERDKEARERDV